MAAHQHKSIDSLAKLEAPGEEFKTYSDLDDLFGENDEQIDRQLNLLKGATTDCIRHGRYKSAFKQLLEMVYG